MIPFLKQIATVFFNHYGAGIRRLAFVFPNRRSGIFFRKYLSEVAGRPIFSPSILTISDLFYKLNPKQQADPVKLLFLLYDVYVRRSGSPEAFDNFVHWGEMLLNDFEDIDNYLVDAKQLFSNVTDLNAIDKDFSFLNPSQVQAIRSFWTTFMPESGDSNKKSFLEIWQAIYPVYTDLRERLASEGFAYDGMIYREVVEGFRNSSARIQLPYEKIVFVGLNALTAAERELMKHFQKQGIADFYWDYSSEKVKDEDNRASFFLKDNIRMFPSAFVLPDEEPVETAFELIGIPSRIGQAKQIYPILQKLYGGKKITASEAIQTAIILPDEQLLPPVLHSIPEQIDRINVTLGYPLSGTSVASLMDCLHSLHKNIKIVASGDLFKSAQAMFYHSDVVAALRHPAVSSACPAEASAIVQSIIERNQVYIPVSALCTTPFLALLFSHPSNILELSDNLITLLKELHRGIEDAGAYPCGCPSESGDAGAYPCGCPSESRDVGAYPCGCPSESEAAGISARSLEQEFIYHYYTIVNRMRELIRTTRTGMTPDTFFKLLKQMTDYIKIPFQGEPLSGLQVMGALETRVLDFENLIILSVNEGVFPAKSVAGSFIPYQLRRGFGLPTPEHQDCVRAYHFYRMIHRAKRVIMLYDTRTDGLQSGEVSRFVHQLKYHYKAPVREKSAVYNIASSGATPFKVDKDEEVMRALALYETENSLSASAINTYLDCPVRFYFTAIKGIDEEKVVSETLRHDMFGTLLHRVMELAYQPFCRKTVTADLLKLVTQEKNMTKLIKKAFARDFFHTDEPPALTGQAYLYGETIRKYACKIIDYDRSLTPFQYIGAEKRFMRTLALTGGRLIRIKGFIDRIDWVRGAVRIIDYKSGRPSELSFTSMESLFDGTEKDRRKAIMQVFLYAWVYAMETGETPIQPAIYYSSNLFRQHVFDPSIYQKTEKEKTSIEHFKNDCPSFEANLRSCLDELFDAGKPFTQTTVIKHCEYCPFAGICGR